MVRLQSLVALLLLALLVPLSSHAFLERCGSIHQDNDHDVEMPSVPDAGGDYNHDVADGHFRMDGTGRVLLKAPASASLTLKGFLALAGWLSEGMSAGAGRPSRVTPGSAPPPDLVVGWRFSARAALPARPPTPVS